MKLLQMGVEELPNIRLYEPGNIGFTGIENADTPSQSLLRPDSQEFEPLFVTESSESSKVHPHEFDWQLEKADSLHELKPLPDELFQGQLPELLYHCYQEYDDTFQRDVALLSAITFCSGLFPNVISHYGRFSHHANLFFFLIAPSSTGKSTLRTGEFMVRPIQEEKTRRELIASYPEMEKIQTFPESLKTRILLKANSSIAAFMDDLRQNEGSGILFTTEGDIIGNSFKQDWGNASAQWRCAWDHQQIDVNRKAVHYCIHRPKLAIILSGTPGQAKNIIPNSEDGLHARFLYYCFGGERKWKSPFRGNGMDTEEYFANLSKKLLLPLWINYSDSEVIFSLSEEQRIELDKRFDNLMQQTASLYPMHTDSIIIRGGANLHRIAMVLTILRSPKPGKHIICTDDDFESAFMIMRTLIQHGIYMTKVKPSLKNADALRLYDSLPKQEIPMSEIFKIGKDLGFSESTIKRYRDMLVTAQFLKRLKHGTFLKINHI